jgi:hypothetical protein
MSAHAFRQDGPRIAIDFRVIVCRQPQIFGEMLHFHVERLAKVGQISQLQGLAGTARIKSGPSGEVELIRGLTAYAYIEFAL